MRGGLACLRQRVAAFGFDYILIAAYLVALVLLSLLLRALAPHFIDRVFATQATAELFGFVTVTFPVFLYFTLSEASSGQASWGKRRRRLTVGRAVDGSRLGIARSLARSALKFTPWELSHASVWYITFHPEAPWPWFVLGLTAVFCLVALSLLTLIVSRKHQTLYDMLAGTTVGGAAIPLSR